MVPNAGIQGENNGRRCDVYANILEGTSGSRMTICSGEARYRQLYTSISNTVEIQIVNTGDNEDGAIYFAIAFQGK